jgi:prepilin-type N-terminal cleavage/methylation domain-containing protein
MLPARIRHLQPGRARESGFTLLEIMVVVVITAIIGGFSIFGIAQAGERRFSTQAGNLQLWLQQLYDLASIEGIPYGIKQNDRELVALVFYRQRWLPVTMPEQFRFNDKANIRWPVLHSSGELPEAMSEGLPDLIVGAYPEAGSDTLLDLGFDGQSTRFLYSWDSEETRLAMDIRKR